MMELVVMYSEYCRPYNFFYYTVDALQYMFIKFVCCLRLNNMISYQYIGP